MNYMTHGTQRRPQAQIKIARLVLSETGTYSPMYSRPYQTHVDGQTLENLVRRVDDAKGAQVSGALFAGVASNMVSPSSAPQGEIPIHMGWSERRIRFFMEVHVTASMGSSFIYYFQGYTSHLGVSHNGNVDPQMQFIINSYIRVNRSEQYGPYGTVTRDIVTESAHIINGAIVNQVPNGDVYGMRPQDIFTGIQSNYLENAYTSYGNGDNSFQDTRVKFTGEAIRSNRINNLPANYVAKIVDGYQTGRQLADFGQSNSDIMSRSQGLVHEASAYENVFIRAISDMQGVHCSTVFNMNNLINLDPNVEAVTNFISLGTTQTAQLHQAGQTEFWHGSNRETLASTVLSNAVPAIMMELMLSQIHFRSTNHDQGGINTTLIVNAKSLTNADMSPNLEAFKRRFEKEVMFDITYGNMELYQVEMIADLFGETRITLSIGNGPLITYTTPSFCDSLLTPIMTMNKDNFYGVVNDFEVLMNQLNDNTSTAALNTIV